MPKNGPYNDPEWNLLYRIHTREGRQQGFLLGVAASAILVVVFAVVVTRLG